MITINYDRISAVRYALLWAENRNPKYYNFDQLGGDCTNFVSQCVFAGCGIMNYSKLLGWHYVSLNYRSPSWTGVDFFNEFMIANHEEGPFGIIVSKENAEIGDIIQLASYDNDFYHSLIITEIRNNQIFVSAHTKDVKNIILSHYNFSKMRIIHILGARKYQ